MDKLRLYNALQNLKSVQNERGAGIKVESETDYCEIFYYRLMNEISITFKGSDNWGEDWFSRKGNLYRFDFNKNGFHDGFERAYKNICVDIHREIQNFIKPDTKVSVEGYSRGGGLGIVCMFDISNTYGIINNVSGTFLGCPAALSYGKISLRSFLFFKNADIIRVVNGWDLVATSRLYKKVGLDHVGMPVQLKQPWWHYFTRRIRDHYFSAYRNEINKL